MNSKTLLSAFAGLLLSAAWTTTANAQTAGPAAATTQHWTPGWGILNEPLNYSKSTIVWSVSASRKLTVTYTLNRARPNKLYQVGLTIFCTTFPATFGQFPTDTNAGNCIPNFLQGVNATAAAVELGVVLTDDVGTGSAKIVVGPITPGTYNLEFDARDGAGCLVTGGGTDPTCLIDFQSPGPFGTATTIVIP